MHRRRTTSLVSTILVMLLCIAPAAASPIDDAVTNANREIPAGAGVEAAAQLSFKYRGAGVYDPVLVPQPSSSVDSAPTVHRLIQAIPNVGDLVRCPAIGEARCDEGSRYKDCTFDLELVWSYERPQDADSTLQRNDSEAMLRCPFADIDGSVTGIVTTSILDRGVPGLGSDQQNKCPGFATLHDPDAWTCDQLRFTAPNVAGNAWATQEVPVLTSRIGVPPVEVHGAGSLYEYRSQFAVTIPEMSATPFYACAYSDLLVDPQATIEVLWVQGTCGDGF